MSRGMICAALCATALAGPALADTCYQRLYSKAHLASQPNQVITALTVRFTPLEQEVVAYVEAQFRDSDKVWKNTLGCYPVDDPSREDGATMSCSVDCDGGVFFLTERENGSVLIRTHGFAVGAGCGDEEDQTRSVADLNQGTKQTVFRLDPLELADCPKWVE